MQSQVNTGVRFEEGAIMKLFNVLCIVAGVLFFSCTQVEDIGKTTVRPESVTIELSASVYNELLQPQQTVMPGTPVIAGYELLGSISGEQISLGLFTTLTGATVTLTAGTWNFTLRAKDGAGAVVLEGVLSSIAVSTSDKTLSFVLKPLVSGVGSVNVELVLPAGHTITSVDTVFNEAVVTPAVAVSAGKITFSKTGIATGSYLLVFKLKEATGAVSATVTEIIRIYPNLTSIKSMTLTTADFNAPPGAAPSLLTVTGGSGIDPVTVPADFTWVDNSNNETGFELYWSHNTGSGTITIPAATTSYTMQAVRGKTYTLKIRALNSFGSSGYSNELSGIGVPWLITYNSMGGTAVAAMDRQNGQTLTAPDPAPTKGDDVFLGWYREESGTTAWIFGEEPVTSSMTLYAKWGRLIAGFNFDTLDDTKPSEGDQAISLVMTDITYSEGSPGTTKSLAFNGITSKIQITGADGYTDNAAPWTVAAWVKPQMGSGSYTLTAGSVDWHGIRVWRDAGNIQRPGVTCSNGDITSLTASISPDIWTHLVMANDGITVKVYLNGQYHSDMPSGAEALGLPISWIGASYGGTSDFFKGLMDQLYFYDIALDQSGVTNLYNKVFSGGSGTQIDPFIVSTGKQLDAVRYFRGKYFSQSANIDLTGIGVYDQTNGVYLWSSIGKTGSEFTGGYNGNNYSITNLLNSYITSVDVVGGLFGVISGADLQNINVTGELSIAESVIATGMLAGIVEGDSMISNCQAHGTINSGIEDINVIIGGLVGKTNHATISDSRSTVDIGGNAGIGGGITGHMISGLIERSFSIGTVNVIGNAGGLVGKIEPMVDTDSVIITRSYSKASAKTGGVQDSASGGLVGRIYTEASAAININNSYANGIVESGFYPGGLVGSVGYATGTPTITIQNCYAAGPIGGVGVPGGLISVASGTETTPNCFYDSETTGVISGNTTAEMITQSTFLTWTFGAGNWTIIEGSSYPYFDWQGTVNIPKPNYPFWGDTWSASVTGGDVNYTAEQSVTPSTKELYLQYNNNGLDPGAGVPVQTWTYTATASKDGTLRFTWEYSGSHASVDANATLKYFVNGVYTDLVPQTVTNGEFNFLSTGTVIINVEINDSYGFQVIGSNGDTNSTLSGTVNIISE